MAVLTAWLNSGINFLYFSAGLGNIDDSIYERASVDGANGTEIFKLTLPGLSPTAFYNNWLLTLIQAFQSFLDSKKIPDTGGPRTTKPDCGYLIYRDDSFLITGLEAQPHSPLFCF